MIHKIKMKQHLLMSFLLFWGASAYAGIITLNNTDAGYIQRDSGTFTHNSGSAFIQRESGQNSNAYYVFDLSGVTDSILSAEFDFTAGWESGTPNLQLFDVNTDINDLMNGNGNLRSIFRDLRQGSYSSSGSPGVFTLNSSAIADLNNASGLFAIGADNLANNSWFWDFSTTLTLTTATPEASEIILMILGLLLLYKFYSDQKKKIQFSNC